MKRLLVGAILIMLICLSVFGPGVFARQSVQQTTPTCPTYQVNLTVIVVDSHPIDVVVGDIVVTTVDVVYMDGSPVTLAPETVSFSWTGSSGQMEFDDAPVMYTGTPGFYNYTQTIGVDLVQATGQGEVTVAVVRCSCSDASSNRGPVSDVNSDLTIAGDDNSNLAIGVLTSTTSTTSQGGLLQPAAYLVPLAIALLLIVALLLLLLRARKKKT